MRYRKWQLVLALALFLAVGVSAQQPSGPPAPQPTDPRLDQLLARWEKETAGIKSMVATIKCTRKNNVFNRTETLEGTAKFMQQADGSYLARLHLEDKGNKNRYETYICTGSHIYVVRPEEKSIYAYSLPVKQQKQLPDDGPMPFLFGMKAETAKKRYQLKLAAKQDEFYTYVDVLPNFARDQADFTYARLAILNKTFLPAQIYWVEPNKVEVTWDVGDFQKNVLGPEHRPEFNQPKLPPGWELKTEQKLDQPPASPAPPTKVRPKVDD